MDKNGLGKASQILTGMAILIAGKNTLGFTGDGTKVSDIEFNTVDEESTGIIKPLVMTLEVNSLNAEFITHITAGLPFVLKGNIHEDGENKSYIVTAQGGLKKMAAEVKTGDAVKRTFELNLNMYSEVVDGLPTVVYTKNPYTCILGGIDTAPNFNDNL